MKAYWTLEEKPASMIFIGGGFISLEYAHFFSALGVHVNDNRQKHDPAAV